jgi:hypothetical protein
VCSLEAVTYQSLTVESEYLTASRQFNLSKLDLRAADFALAGSGTVT